jgi:hypothetical protein
MMKRKAKDISIEDILHVHKIRKEGIYAAGHPRMRRRAFMAPFLANWINRSRGLGQAS